MLNYYWPSKYDIPSFHLDQYLQMQALRYAPKKTHPSLVSLSGLMRLLATKKNIICRLLQQLDAELLKENPTLQDLHALYRSLFPDDPLSGVAPQDKTWRWTDKMKPQTLLGLLELSAKLRGTTQTEFNRILREASECS
ncbi:hypothetical protein, conserved [Eimeria acervulina]|uniref:Uncharacterized protein n=1 Tax=Eimeria acervulina TaxID=5801 RepID=U6GJY8_EIMAC|nr:hypothetical protein, conserved [Eimeria acervulina]CDI79902.1 hypothetical protein, conserved [Eimeria acervulina]